ncbi:MAG: 50S ribosomal protein L18e [Nanoarchaeota archaeon]
MNRIKNPELEKLIADLKTLSATKKSQLWKRIALDLERPTRQRRVVNVYKIDKYALENEVVIVPGKVLGVGELSKKVSVAAFTFSDDARKKISEKGEVMSIPELMAKNPQGKGVRILG